MPSILNLWARLQGYVTIMLGVTTLAFAAGWYVNALKIDALNNKVTACSNARKADRNAYEAASNKAEAEAQLAARNKEQEYNDKADAADAAYSGLYNQYNLALLRYKNAQKASSPAQSGSTEGGNRSSSDTNLSKDWVSIPYVDAEVCASNTARLVTVHDWAIKLNK